MADKVAKSKVYLDGLGKDLVSGIKAQAKVIDKERRGMRERLDMLKAEVRAPLTQWEDAEKARISEILTRIADMARPVSGTVEEIEAAVTRLEEIPIDEFAEYGPDASKAKDAALRAARMELRRSREFAELERLRQQERLRRERDEEMKREAALKATREAEQKARRKEAQDRRTAQAERERLERAKAEAQVKAANAERRLKEAEERAKRDAEQAARKERERIEAEARAKQEEGERRAADLDHRAQVMEAAVDALLENCELEHDQAVEVLNAIMLDKVPHVRISF